MTLIRFLLISIALLYIVRLIARLLLPALFQKIVNKAQQQQNGYNNNYRTRPEGKIKVDYAPDNKPSVPDTEGEFVDFEEIKNR